MLGYCSIYGDKSFRAPAAANSGIQVVPICTTSGPLLEATAVSSLSCAVSQGIACTSTLIPGFAASYISAIGFTVSAVPMNQTFSVLLSPEAALFELPQPAATMEKLSISAAAVNPFFFVIVLSPLL
ncbi:hypothetical protein D3C75_384000 [compost metagenome]